MTSVPTTLSVLPYRQVGRPDPGRLMELVTMAVIVYVFAGIFVYWLRTGSWTIGEGGRMTNLGGLIWVAPLFLWFVIYLIRARGPFARLWRPLARLDVDQEGIAWDVDGQTGHADWADVHSVREALAASRSDSNFLIRDVGGQILGRVPGRIVAPDGRKMWVVDLVIETRPDLFVRVGRPRRLAAVRQEAAPYRSE